MRKDQALKKYKKDKDIIEFYQDADRYAWVNVGDESLVPIRITLPECPAWDKIEGYGLDPYDQIVRREHIPSNIVLLEKEVRKNIKKDKSIRSIVGREKAIHELLWDELSNNSEKFKAEIYWLKTQWYFKEHGKWFFVNGKPTFLDGWHWFFLNYWNMEGEGLPDYRDRDRRWFHAQRFALEDTTVPKRDKDGNLMFHLDGSLQLKDIGTRVCLGTNNIKSRRVGDTSKTSCIHYCIISTEEEVHGGIQGEAEGTGEMVFKRHIMSAFKKMPFFFKPATLSLNPQHELEFNSDDPEIGLASTIDYATTAHRSHYDGQKLRFYHGDEPAKIVTESINERHRVVKNCLSVGGLDGFMIYTSTVGEMSRRSGEKFFILAEQSHYEKRDKNGQTKSGIYNIVFAAWDGLQGFVGRFGESIIESPTDEQIPYLKIKIKNESGEYIGAREYKMNAREQLKEDGDIAALAEEKRLFPGNYLECFTPPANNIFFDVDILETRINYLKAHKEEWVEGNFHRVGGGDGDVVFRAEKDGRFKISELLDKSEGKVNHHGVWFPYNTDKRVASADAYRLEHTESSEISNGGGAVRLKRDITIDTDDVPVDNWSTARTVCTYNYRPSTIEEYCSDMLNMCEYYGAMMYPEMNVTHVYDYFVRRGYQGYLLYDTDTKTGKRAANPGFHSGIEKKRTLFNLMRSEIKLHAARSRHMDWLKECLAISGLKDMTHYDLFTAVGGTLLAEQSQYGKHLADRNKVTIDIDDLGIPMKNY